MQSDYQQQQQQQQQQVYANDSGGAYYYSTEMDQQQRQQQNLGFYQQPTSGGSNALYTQQQLQKAAIVSAVAAQVPTQQATSGAVFEPPHFLRALQPQLVVVEGKSFSLTTKADPVADPSLSVEWNRNGIPVCAGSRINTKFDRGFAVLEVLYSIANDSGTYTCVAKSKSGYDQTSGCHVEVLRDAGVDRETQLPDQEMVNSITRIEAYLADTNRPVEREDLDPSGGRPARFLKPLGPQAAIHVRENKPIHLETCVAPANDPSLAVEWFKNGVAIPMSSRYKFELDRGFAIFDIQSSTTDDSGQYFCVAKNKHGAVQSNIVSIKCLEDPSIVTQSALPQESVNYLNSIDAPADPSLRYESLRYQEVVEPDSAPVFDVMPESLAVLEKNPAKFLVKISGKPSPRVLWFMNGILLAPTTNCRIYNDGAINYLEFHRCEDLGPNLIQVVARNELGEAMADAQLIVNPNQDFRPELRHVMPESTLRKTQDLESARRNQNAHAYQLRRVDRASSLQAKGKLEVEQAEILYQNVQSRLRRSERPLLPDQPAAAAQQHSADYNLSSQMQNMSIASTQQQPQQQFKPQVQVPTQPQPPQQQQFISHAPPQQQFYQQQQQQQPMASQQYAPMPAVGQQPQQQMSLHQIQLQQQQQPNFATMQHIISLPGQQQYQQQPPSMQAYAPPVAGVNYQPSSGPHLAYDGGAVQQPQQSYMPGQMTNPAQFGQTNMGGVYQNY